MKSRFVSLNADFAGFMASMICAVHCAALPFVLTIGALSNLAWLEHGLFEVIFITLSIIIASWSLVRSYFQRHHSLRAIFIAAAGFSVIIASRFVEGDWEHWLTMIGGIIIATGHIVNWRLVVECQVCHSTSCAHTEEDEEMVLNQKVLQPGAEKISA
ncbi:MAG: MerC domain-containing protein [Saprospiraceae bacterium]|nr:MerC domain-containing protein [Saprospiraceae bacterium]MDZ4703604.1 MerC domain-containing protein [Saprospiraceae bacterium]